MSSERAITISRLTPEMEGRYDRFIDGRSDALLYHSTKYKRFLKSLLGCNEYYLVAESGGEIRGVLPILWRDGELGRVYNSLPYYGSNGGVLADGEDVRDFLHAEWDRISQADGVLSATYIENPFAQTAGGSPGHDVKDVRIAQFTILPEDGSRAGLMSLISSSARRNIRKAENEGISVVRDASAIVELERIHRENMEAIGGLAKSSTFFEQVPKSFENGVDYEIYTARWNSETVAALLAFFFNETVEYYTPAVDVEHRSRQPLSLILLHAMMDAVSRGYRRWNWGGTWKTQGGVYAFKKKWSASEKDYQYFVSLRDEDVRNWSRESLMEHYPGFYVLPFDQLRRK